MLAGTLIYGTACAQDRDFAAEARDLAKRYLLVDTHIDVPYRLEENWEDVTRTTAKGDFDFVRARRGGLDVAFMSIYTPAEAEAEGTSFQLANRLIDTVEALVGRAPEQAMLVRSTGDAELARQKGLLGLAMGMENGAPVEGDLNKLAHFRERGISYITLAHSLANHISDSSYDEERKWGGLSPFGRALITEMNRLGILIDISHVTDAAFHQVLELSRVPVIASHSSARRFTPGWERNMSDEMIRALAARGGVIQINFGSSFLIQEARAWYDSMSSARKAYLAENGYDEHGEEATRFRDAWREEHPFPYAGMDDVVAHFRHVIALVGVEHVGIGSDFDGVGDSLPLGMKDVSDYPNLVEALLRDGLSESEIQAILGGNLMRVWRAAEAFAEGAG
ncbi:MAG: dipeptidase [Gammaproteobacteria bacterium]|nr:dipeptidase [Gammaproteobacteria bacterium]